MKFKSLTALTAGITIALSSLGAPLGAKAETMLHMQATSRYDSGVQNEDGGTTEIVAYNADNQKYYVINGTTKQIEVVALPNTASFTTLKAEKSINLEEGLKKIKPTFTYGDVTSISINTELKTIVAAVQAAGTNDNGLAVFLNYDGVIQHVVEAGKQPDMITFTPDGKKALVANEGEPREGYDKAVDPEGSVTVIDLANGITNATAQNVTFEALDAQREKLVAQGVIVKKNTAPSVDFEPEYIAVNAASDKAYVTLQEANAIATLDLTTNQWIDVKSLGLKDHSLEKNALDFRKDKKIAIQPENLFGLYMPDGIASYEVNGKTYLVTANEGDSRDWEGYINEIETELDGNEVVLFDPSDYDGLDASKTYSFGARSFSIYEADTMKQVYDSGSDFEKLTAQALPEYFNVSNNNTKLDNRSGKKGPEPEDVKIGQIADRFYAFVGLERIGGIMMYDITNPSAPTFVQYINERDFSEDIKGDVSPEGLAFIAAEKSPTGLPTLLAAHEVSGTVAAYTIGAPKAVTFTDIQGHWAQTAIEHVASVGIFKGVTKERFNPNEQLTKAQFITALSRTQQLVPSTSAPFTDVKATHYFSEAVAWAYDNQLIETTSRQFKPNNAMTREQAAQILYRYLQQTGYEFLTQQTQAYTDDATISSAAKEAVYALQQAGIMTGNEQQQFNPQATLTRAEAAAILSPLF
ncbi:choice-of-anchor I family protein [Lysinibacillus louembei]|uniref:Choice-of-anchor I family protein n=1 Tax=Lysinibacillus louembei TaxID=1470088 RepID=A0ABZ0RVH6_9BACI|nr:choice-of-anchor I family protein [Lysinibacillus louembei]WPK10973.1 choice-of-anchor I family protein [Lysinibacillus louembei]